MVGLVTLMCNLDQMAENKSSTQLNLQSQNTPNPSPKDRSLDGERGRPPSAGWPDGKETVISGMLRVSADRRRPRYALARWQQ